MAKNKKGTTVKDNTSHKSGKFYSEDQIEEQRMYEQEKKKNPNMEYGEGEKVDMAEKSKKPTKSINNVAGIESQIKKTPTEEVETEKVAETETPTKNYVENSNEGVANAKAGDWIKRSNGEEVQLTQEDIDFANLNKPKKEVETETEEVVEQPSVPAEESVEQDPSEYDENSIDEEQQNDLDALSNNPIGEAEVQIDEAVNTNDPSKLTTQNIDGTEVTYLNEDGSPHVFSIQEARQLQGQGKYTNDVLTLTTCALHILTAGIVPVVNFDKIRGTEVYMNELNKVAQAQSDYYKETHRAADTTSANVEAQESAYKEQQENPEAFSRESTEATARANEAVTGGSTLAQTEMTGQQAMQQLNSQQDFEKLMFDKKADFDKWAKQFDAQFQESFLRLQQDLKSKGEIELAQALNDMEVKKACKEIAYAEQMGYSLNDIAKLYKSKGGKTYFDNAIDVIKYYTPTGDTAMKTGGEIVSGIFDLGSSKDVKTFKTRNTEMLRKACRW